MSSVHNQIYDVANLRMLDRILRKGGFRGGELYGSDDREINATSFLMRCFQMGIIEETALQTALRVHLTDQLDCDKLPPAAMEDGSLWRWQDDGGAPVRVYKITRFTGERHSSAPLRPGGYRFPKAGLPERSSDTRQLGRDPTPRGH
jgi:hypothetical protein